MSDEFFGLTAEQGDALTACASFVERLGGPSEFSFQLPPLSTVSQTVVNESVEKQVFN